MFDIVVTKQNINLMSPVLLIDLITKIETHCAGWWWSINQEPHMLTLSMGPGRNSPNPADVAFSLTKLGDHGFIMTHPTGEVIMPILPDWMDRIFNKVDLYREDTVRHTDLTKLPKTNVYRRQTSDDLSRLNDSYLFFLNSVRIIETHGYVLHQVHLGSCDLTVDCSLRGFDKHNQPFDISHDYGDDAVIADSLTASLEDLVDQLHR